MRYRALAGLRTILSIAFALIACAPARSVNVAPTPINPISPGDRLRVTHSSACCTSPSIGIEQSANPDTLFLQPIAGNQRFMIPRSSINKIERWNRGQTHMIAGGMLGLLGGAASGAVVGYASGCHRNCDGDWRALTAIMGGIA